MKTRITELDVHTYVAKAAESIIEDDFDEGAEYTDEVFAELKRRAFRLMKQMSDMSRYSTLEE